MRHVVVSRSVAVLGLLLVGACLLFARLATRPGATSTPPASGEALFESRCAGCHVTEEVDASLRAPAEPRAARDALRRFLDAHGHSSPDEGEAIVDFLAARARGA